MFVIVRHGNTFESGETPRRIGARTDLPLTDKGFQQASALGEFFRRQNWEFGRALVAPLLRTRATAELILSHQLNAPDPEFCQWLREIDHGPDENQTEDDVVARIGKDSLEQWDRHAEPPPDWTVDSGARIDAWRTFFAESDHLETRPTLIVTSNGAARFALLAARSLLTSAANLPTMKLPTGGYGVIEKGENGDLQVALWGERP